MSLLCFTALLQAEPAQKDGWLPISPAELAETSSPTNPDTPAEILYYRIESDLRRAPLEFGAHEYLRYKIYNPEKSDAYSRIHRFDPTGYYASLSDLIYFRNKITARLTLPDGTTRLFTDADVKERPLLKRASDNSALSRLFTQYEDVKERFLAITGVVPGSILEYQIDTVTGMDLPTVIGDKDSYIKQLLIGAGITHAITLQNPDLPVRNVELLVRAPTDKNFLCKNYTINRSIGNATLTEDRKKGTVSIVATNLPPSYREPFSGPSPYYSLTVLQYLSGKESLKKSRQNYTMNVSVDVKKDGPWSPVAATAYVEWEDSSEVSGKVKQLAKEITASATTPEEKARLIHNYVQNEYQAFRNKPTPKGRAIYVRYMDDILSRDKEPELRLVANDFLFLANALYKAVGLETRGVLFPDRNKYPFSPTLVASGLLPVWTVAVKLNDQWQYSMPQSKVPIPFGMLPWFCERQMGLVMKAGPQELFEAPAGKSAAARILNTAQLTLSPDGTLTGDAKRTYVGQHAYAIRARLGKRTGKALTRFFHKIIADDFKVAMQSATLDEANEADNDTDEEKAPKTDIKPNVVINNIKGLENPEASIEIEYTLYLPGYAQNVADRLIFHPAVFRSSDQHTFSADTRHTPIRLPFPWQEIDKVTLTYPEGYAPESLDMPSLPPSPVLFYKNTLTDDPATHTLTYRRQYASELTYIPVEQYEPFKNWTDETLTADQYQLILTKKSAP